MTVTTDRGRMLCCVEGRLGISTIRERVIPLIVHVRNVRYNYTCVSACLAITAPKRPHGREGIREKYHLVGHGGHDNTIA